MQSQRFYLKITRFVIFILLFTSSLIKADETFCHYECTVIYCPGWSYPYINRWNRPLRYQYQDSFRRTYPFCQCVQEGLVCGSSIKIQTPDPKHTQKLQKLTREKQIKHMRFKNRLREIREQNQNRSDQVASSEEINDQKISEEFSKTLQEIEQDLIQEQETQ